MNTIKIFILYNENIKNKKKNENIKNKKKSSSRSYIFHCSDEWKYKFYIFTSENITFSKYAFYFINNSLYFITLYIIKKKINVPTLPMADTQVLFFVYMSHPNKKQPFWQASATRYM